MTSGPSAPKESGQEGMSMVELIITIAVSALVLSVLAMIFGNAMSTQAATGNRDVASGRSQVVANSLQTGIRNASDFTTDGTLLRARVADVTGGGWHCEAWKLADQKLQFRRSNTAIQASDSGWTVLAAGAKGNLASGAVFQATTGKRLSYAFTVTEGTGSTAVAVPVQGAVLARANGSGSPATCW